MGVLGAVFRALVSTLCLTRGFLRAVLGGFVGLFGAVLGSAVGLLRPFFGGVAGVFGGVLGVLAGLVHVLARITLGSGSEGRSKSKSGGQQSGGNKVRGSHAFRGFGRGARGWPNAQQIRRSTQLYGHMQTSFPLRIHMPGVRFRKDPESHRLKTFATQPR